jgi:type I restriction enzyme S subunit
MKEIWPAKSLGDVCQLISGQHIDAKDYNLQMQGIGYLTGPSDFGPIHPVVSKWTEHPKITAIRGDLLLTVKGSGVGKVNLLDDDEVAISRQLMAVRVTGADPRFIYAIISSTFDHFQSLYRSCNSGNLSRASSWSDIYTPPSPRTAANRRPARRRVCGPRHRQSQRRTEPPERPRDL